MRVFSKRLMEHPMHLRFMVCDTCIPTFRYMKILVPLPTKEKHRKRILRKSFVEHIWMTSVKNWNCRGAEMSINKFFEVEMPINIFFWWYKASCTFVDVEHHVNGNTDGHLFNVNKAFSPSHGDVPDILGHQHISTVQFSSTFPSPTSFLTSFFMFSWHLFVPEILWD